jgi:PAS domain S-box-containing protein
MTRFYCFLILLVLSISTLHAQLEAYGEDWRWAHFTTESGLPSNNVSDVVETAQGTVWAATSSGLAWFDGFRWRSVNDTSAFPKKQPSWLATDSNGELLTIIDGHIFIGDTDRFTPFECNLDPNEQPVSSIVPLGHQDYFITGSTSLFISHQGKLERTVGLGSLAVANNKVFYTRDKGIWINTIDGLFRWDGTKWIKKLNASTKPFEVFHLVEDSHGAAFASIAHPMDYRGLWTWKPGGPPVHNIREGRDFLKALDVSPTGEALAVYRSGDVRTFLEGKWSTIEDPPSQMKNSTFLKFRENGDLWIGTQSGLYLCKRSSTRWTYWRHSFPDLNNTINEIVCARDSSIWIGTEGGIEVHRPDGTVKSFQQIDGTNLFVVTGMCEDNEGGIWISSGSGFDGAYRWNGKKWKHYGMQEGLGVRKIHKIRMDRQGRLWFLGIGEGIKNPDEAPGAYVYTGKRFSRWGVPEGLLSGRVYSFEQGPDGALWFGTWAGLCRWKNGTWKYWTGRDGLKMNRIFTLTVDQKNRVWFGHQIRGLGSIGEDEVPHYYTTADGLIGDEVWEVRTDAAGKLWISTSEGLSCFHEGLWSSFSQSTGLNYLRLWPVLPLKNRVYIGTAGNGVSILNLNELDRPNPEIAIAEPIVQEDQISLRWEAFSFWGEVPSAEIQTRFRLDNDPWSQWSLQHKLTRSDLSIGEHVLHIEANGLFEQDESAGQTTRFTVRGPFYKRTAFVMPLMILSLAVLGLAAILFIRKRRHEMNLRSITETTSSAIFIFDNSSFIYVNSSAESLMGCARNELLTMGLYDIIHPDYKEILREQAARWLKGKSLPYRAELKVIRKDGEERWAGFTIGRIRYGGTEATLVTAVDITERKQAEDKLIAYQEKLKSLASELTLTGERERRRMAAFLHDSICQSLIFCKIKLAALREARSHTEIEAVAHEISSLVDQSIEDTQTLTFELSPPILYELGFEPAIEWLIERMYEQHKLRISFSTDRADKPLADDIRVVLFQAVREALINIVKHAQVQKASLSSFRDGHNIRIIIEDDGRGFDNSRQGMRTSENGGFGLFNMSERVRHLGGEVKIESHIGEGTKIILSAPLKESPNNNPGHHHEY